MKRFVLVVAAIVSLATPVLAVPADWVFRGSHGSEVGGADWDCGSSLSQVGTLATYQWVWSGATAGAYEFKVQQVCDAADWYGSSGACAVGSTCSLSVGGGNSAWTALGGKTYTVNARQNGGNIDVAILETAAVGMGILSVAQNSPTGAVDPGTPVKIRVTTSGALPADQVVYVRWSADGWATSTIVKAVNTSATLHDATLAVPAFADALEGNDIAYYAFVSPKTDLDTVPFDADLAFLTIDNNGGSNYTLDVYNLANAWHNPAWAEPSAVATMRVPATVDASDTKVYVYSGVQFQGPGRNSNQTLLKLHYKKGAAGWAVLQTLNTDIFFDTTEGNNKYWRAELPGPFAAGQDVRYVLEIDSSDRDPTYLYGAGDVNTVTGDLTKARSLTPTINPWSFNVAVVLGDGFHTPTAAEPSGETMRNPVAPDTRLASTVKVWFAEPDAGDVDPVTFVKVFYSFDGITWSDSGNITAIAADNQNGNDYYSYDIPISGKKDGATLRYYFFVQYDAVVLDSYFYWNGAASAVTQSEATAKTGAFSVVLAGPPIPTLSEWAMILALLSMVALAVRELRRRGFHPAA